MRGLLSLLSTMRSIDESNVEVNMALKYTDGTPEDYEPPHFKKASKKDLALSFPENQPTDVMRVGQIRTPYHRSKVWCVGPKDIHSSDSPFPIDEETDGKHIAPIFRRGKQTAIAHIVMKMLTPSFEDGENGREEKETLLPPVKSKSQKALEESSVPQFELYQSQNEDDEESESQGEAESQSESQGEERKGDEMEEDGEEYEEYEENEERHPSQTYDDSSGDLSDDEMGAPSPEEEERDSQLPDLPLNVSTQKNPFSFEKD